MILNWCGLTFRLEASKFKSEASKFKLVTSILAKLPYQNKSSFNPKPLFLSS